MILPKIFCLIDTEFTAWKGSQENNWSKKGEEKEIIQISGLKLELKDNKLKILDRLNIFVKPKINPILSDYIINLTGITNEKINIIGISFNEAIKELYDFCYFKNNLLNVYSYGNDYNIIHNNLILNNLKDKKYYDWYKKHYDLRYLLIEENIPVNNYSSGTLYKHFNIDVVPDVHNSEWDVLSMYYSLNKLLK